MLQSIERITRAICVCVCLTPFHPVLHQQSVQAFLMNLRDKMINIGKRESRKKMYVDICMLYTKEDMCMLLFRRLVYNEKQLIASNTVGYEEDRLH